MTDAELLSRLLAGACEVDERLLEDLLAEGVPASVALRRASRGWWHGGVALLLGTTIALGGARGAAAHEATAPSVAPAAIASSGAGAVGTVAASIAGGAAGEATAGTLDAALAEAPIMADTVLFIPDMSADGAPNQQSGQLYTVVSGDTLSGIAQRYYGNAALWPTIYNANTNLIADPHWIYPGQVFSIPAAPTPTIPPAQSGQGQTSASSYTVQPGDSLWAIAQYRYGNPLRWQDIYNANAAVIGGNPSLIFSGTVLSLPS